MLDRAQVEGLSTQRCLEIDDAHGVRNYRRRSFVPERADGAYLYTPEGVKVFDCLASYGVIVSHCWDVPRRAIMQCLREMDAVSGAVQTPHRARFQKAITRFSGYSRVFMKSGGGEMMETAYTALFMHATRRGIPREKQKIALVKNFFHGRMRSSQTNSSDPDQRAGKGPRVRGFVRVSRTIQAVERALSNPNCIGIVLEKHQGEAGPIFDSRGTQSFYAAVHTIARTYGKLVVVDDVQAGMYRCGYRFSWMEDGEAYRPDATVVAKSLGGGDIPVAAMLSTDDFMSVFVPGSDGSTFGSYPPACAAATAVVEYMEAHPEMGARSLEVGKRFVDNLTGIPHVTVDHRGSMIGAYVRGLKSPHEACDAMLRTDRPAYVMAGHSYPRGSYIRLSPPFLATTDKDIDDICRYTIRPVLERVSRQLVHSK